MDLKTVHLLIQKRRDSQLLFIDEQQYSLKEVIAYIKLHPAKIVHIQTIENEKMRLEAYIPSNSPQLARHIAFAMKAKVYY